MLGPPQARTDGIVAEWVADELVIYDQASQTAHCLSAEVAAIWEACNGRRSAEQISRGLAVEPPVVERALQELSGCRLLDEGPAAERGYSRREAAARVAKIGGAAFSAPLIYSIAIGSAAAAASACRANGQSESGCTATAGATAADAQCCSGTCYHVAGSGSKICVESDCVVAGGLCVLGLIPCCSGAGHCTGVVVLTCTG